MWLGERDQCTSRLFRKSLHKGRVMRRRQWSINFYRASMRTRDSVYLISRSNRSHPVHSNPVVALSLCIRTRSKRLITAVWFLITAPTLYPDKDTTRVNKCQVSKSNQTIRKTWRLRTQVLKWQRTPTHRGERNQSITRLEVTGSSRPHPSYSKTHMVTASQSQN